MNGQDLTLKVGFDIDKFQKELSKTNGMLSKWAAGVQSSLMGVAAGFSAMALGEAIFDMSKLAGEAQGVREAFDKLPNSVALMENLKRATAGTVSELNLMKRAVMASQFDISLEALPKLLEFATIRAKQTGQSVDSLVESIILGIGRKSTQILDNLGISATRLKEKFNGAALEAQSIADVAQAVGDISTEELAKMGKMSENTATKIERLNAAWDNFKVGLGSVFNSSGAIGSFMDKLSASLTRVGELFTKLATQSERGAQTTWDPAPVKDKAKEIENIANLTERLNALQQNQTLLTGDSLAATNKEIQVITDKIKALKELGLAQSTPRKLTSFVPNLGDNKLDPFNSPIVSYANTASAAMATAAASIQSSIDSINLDNLHALWEQQEQQMLAIAATAAQLSVNLSDSFASLLAGQQSLAQALASSANAIVNEFQKIALAAIIKKAATQPFGAVLGNIALATAGFAAIKTLFAKIGGSGGGSIPSFNQSNRADTLSREMNSGFKFESLGQRVQLEVGWTGDAGKILKTIAINQDRKDTRRRA